MARHVAIQHGYRKTYAELRPRCPKVGQPACKIYGTNQPRGQDRETCETN